MRAEARKRAMHIDAYSMEVKMPGRKLQWSKYLASATFLFFAIGVSFAVAEKKYGPGVTDTEIKIGNTMPYSGPASAVGAIGHTLTAYFKRLNERGGVNGRKIKFSSLDDGFSPPKTMEQTRRLVEEEQVAFIFAPLGTASNSVTQKYLNANKVPQAFLGVGLDFEGCDRSVQPPSKSGLTLRAVGCLAGSQTAGIQCGGRA